VTLVLMSTDPRLGDGFGTGGMGRVWHLWVGAASLCEASTELKSLSRAFEGTPMSGSDPRRFRAALETSNKDPAMRRSLLAIGVLRLRQDDSATSSSFRGLLFFRAGGVAYRG
jgi:hypothetical protein